MASSGEAIINKKHGVVNDMSEIQAVGHRVVHAGEKYASSVLITEGVMAALEECVACFTVTQSTNLLGIRMSGIGANRKPVVAWLIPHFIRQ